MSRSIAVGIDIGTYQVKVVVSESRENAKTPRVIGAGMAESKGLRHGYILNHGDAVKAVRQAVAQAERSSGIQVKKALVSIGGIGLQSTVHSSAIATTRADLEVTDLDIEKVIEQCENEIPKANIINRKVIHPIVLGWKIDGSPVLGKPEGMKGARLEVKMLFITCLDQHVRDLVETINDAGIEVVDVVAAPIAASLVSLTKTQKIAGCVLANIGAETVSAVVYENNLPISLEVFPVGSTDITNDIALGLRVPLDEAENLKRGVDTGTSVSKKKLDDIVLSRLTDIFELIGAHLKKIGKDGLLPAGIIMTGGGAGLATIEDLARAYLKLPSKIAVGGISTKDGVKDATWSVAYGLCLLGLKTEDAGIYGPNSHGNIVGQLVKKAFTWLSRFLP